MFPPGLASAPGGAGGHASPEQVAMIQRLMHGGGPPPGGPTGGPGGPPPNGHGMAPLDQIQSIIQDIHDAMRNIPDPQIVNVLATCLKAVTGVQQQMMAKGGGPGGA